MIDPVVVTSPMAVWVMGFISLLVLHGCSKVLVIINYFSHFIWAFACANQQACDVIKALEELYDTLGMLPSWIMSDGVSHFDCAEVTAFLATHGC